MKKHKKINYKIDDIILKNYVEAINYIDEPMSQIKVQLSESNKKVDEPIRSISIMSTTVKDLSKEFPNNKSKIYTDTIRQIIDTNNGMLSTKMIEPLNIGRQYLAIMEDNGDIEKVSRGIYISPDAFDDSYYTFQLKYKKAIFSHMNALYFYGMTEEFPYTYTITVPQSYHAEGVNKNCNVFYVSNEIYEMGAIEIKTPSSNKIRAYDKERCICDIIKSKNRMDPEQVKKSIKQYVKRKDRNITKLMIYAKKMGIEKKVMEMVGAYY